MNRTAYLTCGLMVLALGCSPSRPHEARPESPPKDIKKAQSDVREYWDNLAEEIKLTEAQKAQLKNIINAKEAAEAAWEKKSERYDDLNKRLYEAQKAKDTQKAESIRKELKPLRDERKQLFKKHNIAAAVKKMLSDEQKVDYIAIRLRGFVMRRYKKLDITDKQKAQIKVLCAELSPQMVKADGWQAEEKLAAKLLRSVYDEVLTAEQKVDHEAGKLYEFARRSYRKASLSDKQKARIKTLCKKVAGEIVTLKTPKAKQALITKLQDSVYEDILTAEQKADLEGNKLYGKTIRMRSKAKVTDQQNEQTRALCKKVGAEMATAKDPQAKDDLTRKLLDAVYKDILTAEQRGDYEAAELYTRTRRMCGKAGLTDEQKTRIKALCKEVGVEMAVAADLETKETLAKKFLNTIPQEVLTAEQRQKLEGRRPAETQPTRPAGRIKLK